MTDLSSAALASIDVSQRKYGGDFSSETEMTQTTEDAISGTLDALQKKTPEEKISALAEHREKSRKIFDRKIWRTGAFALAAAIIIPVMHYTLVPFTHAVLASEGLAITINLAALYGTLYAGIKSLGDALGFRSSRKRVDSLIVENIGILAKNNPEDFAKTGLSADSVAKAFNERAERPIAYDEELALQFKVRQNMEKRAQNNVQQQVSK